MTGGIEVRPETRYDVDAVTTLVAAAFGRRDEADLVVALRADPSAWLPGLSLVAVEAGTVVGHVLVTRAALDGPQGGPIAALAPVAVLPDRQGQGIGSLLVRSVLEAATTAGEGLVVVLGHSDWYPRFGFRPARPLGVVAPFPVDDATWLAVDLGGSSDTPRGCVVYPPAFSGVS